MTQKIVTNPTTHVYKSLIELLRNNRLVKATEYSDKKHPGLMDSFIQVAKRDIDRLVTHPELYADLKATVLGVLGLSYRLQAKDVALNGIAFSFITYVDRLNYTVYNVMEATNRETGDLVEEHTFCYKGK